MSNVLSLYVNYSMKMTQHVNSVMRLSYYRRYDVRLAFFANDATTRFFSWCLGE